MTRNAATRLVTARVAVREPPTVVDVVPDVAATEIFLVAEIVVTAELFADESRQLALMMAHGAGGRMSLDICPQDRCVVVALDPQRHVVELCAVILEKFHCNDRLWAGTSSRVFDLHAGSAPSDWYTTFCVVTANTDDSTAK